ncbi:hypothetical protein [Phenylobacterium sp.]|uniref:hypothetical protein n=1 Tax=Phenylobacterium sp. TaxID=1871053 RepID=UPI002731625C|nr:hypothetical protein [Phenylobacterium sp.]MDP2214992.1 hypothetical protein [Phenylobacterium sp.]
MADNVGEPAIAAALAKLASIGPGFAGAVVSLAWVEDLTVRGRGVAVMVGLVSAIFLGPAICDLVDLFWPGEGLPAGARTGALFMTGLCAMGCLPKLLDWLKRVAGDPLSLLKVRGGAQ